MMVASLGIGVGWRPELAWFLERRRDLGFVEIIAEDFNSRGPIPTPIERLRKRGVPVVPHGVTLSLGSPEPPAAERLAALRRLARLVDAPLVSEHLAFVRGGGVETGHLLPLPRTREAIEIVIENVRAAKKALPVPLAIENIATLLEWPGAEMDEASFFREVLERADVLLLLDMENLYANSRNHHFDPLAYLHRLPLERIAYVHVGGGVERGGLYHDTHGQPVPEPVLALLRELAARTSVPGVLLERDNHFGPDEELTAELDAIVGALAEGATRREHCYAP